MFSLLEIENFKSIGSLQKIEFAVPQGGLGLTVIVGPNNVGKSTVIDAIKFFRAPDLQIDVEERRNRAGVFIRLQDHEGVSKTLSRDGKGATHSVKPRDQAGPPNYQFVPSRRYWTARDPSPAMNASDYNSMVQNVPKGGQDTVLLRRIVQIEQENQGIELTNILTKLIPGFSTWYIERSNGQNILVYKTGSGIEHDANLFGDGISSLFRIGVSLLDTPENGTCLIDEPELSLHPQAQKRLAEFLAQQAKVKQIIVTTHSPHFVRWKDLNRGARLYRLNKFNDVETSVHKLEQKTIEDLKSLAGDWQKPQMLDALAKEAFFSEFLLILEGQEDVGLFLKELDTRNIDMTFDIFGYGAAGSGNIPKFMQVASDIGVPMAALYDKGKEQEMEITRRRFPHARIFSLPTEDIRDKMKRDEKGKETDQALAEGIFDRRGDLKPHYSDYVAQLLMDIQEYFAEVTQKGENLSYETKPTER